MTDKQIINKIPKNGTFSYKEREVVTKLSYDYLKNEYDKVVFEKKYFQEMFHKCTEHNQKLENRLFGLRQMLNGIKHQNINKDTEEVIAHILKIIGGTYDK